MEARRSIARYNDTTPTEIHSITSDMEDEVCFNSHFILHQHVEKDTRNWIPDTGNTRSRQTRYIQTIDLYWHIKTLLGHVLVEHSKSQTELLLCIDDILEKVHKLEISVSTLIKKLVALPNNSPVLNADLSPPIQVHSLSN